MKASFEGQKKINNVRGIILSTKYLVFDTLKDFFVIFALRLEIPFMIVHNHFKRKYFHMHYKKTIEKL